MADAVLKYTPPMAPMPTSGGHDVMLYSLAVVVMHPGQSRRCWAAKRTWGLRWCMQLCKAGRPVLACSRLGAR